MNMPSVFKTTVPYMIDLELHSACGGPLQLCIVLVYILFYITIIKCVILNSLLSFL